ncbi:glycosyltransferase [Waterburya agarophytonicola K14]|uniref:Glycosyltransferase n=1 Tax=Waterburya agarophytonicola KI4 TaxID=2874699 RepID=A0A964FHS4_9CYAN|nr:glycosyltransferase [Waterburya agarophytonicola]MCC0177748.1 glycosyltransferase [Waterburya agarophytonicola KI4]
MRIAFFIDKFPILSETFILNQITGLIDRGYEVDIYCDRGGNRAEMHPAVEEYQLLQRTYSTFIPRNIILRCLKGIILFLLNFLKAPQTVLNSLTIKSGNSPYGDLADFLKPLYLTVPLLNKKPYDIIHCHYGRNGLKAVLLKDLGVIEGKIVVAFHGNDISRYLKIHGDRIYDYLFERGDLFQPISQHWSKKLIALGCNPDKIVIHHMGIDCDKFMPPQDKNTDPEEILIVSIARLVEKKGLSYGIQAIAQLILQYPQLKLQYHLVGDGVLKQELTKQIEQLKMKDRVKLLGWKKQQEVRAIIDRADIVLAPSVTSQEGDCEGIPVSLMEAMAQAIPVVSTYHSGIPELVEDGVTGYLVPEKEVDSLQDKLDNLTNNFDLRQKMGRGGRAKVMQEFNIALLCDRLSQIYQELVS